MDHASLIRDYVRTVLAEVQTSNSAVLIAPNQGDVAQALHWLKLNGLLRNVSGGDKGSDGLYRFVVRHYGSHNDFVATVKSRFGSFIDVQ